MSHPPLDTWRSDDGSFVLRYAPRVLEEIRASVVMAMHGPGRGGIETGGILLGGATGDGEYHLEDWRSIRCDHSRGASFLLSSRDVAALSCQVEGLSGGGTGGVLGWFAAHTRGELGLRAEEQQLHGRVFHQQAPLFLTVVPGKFGDAELRFHLIAGGSHPSASTVPGRLRITPAPGLAKNPNPEAPAATKVVRATGRRSRRWPLPLAAVASLIIFAATGWHIWRTLHNTSAPAPPPPIVEPDGEPVPLNTLHISRSGDRLDIAWDELDAKAESITATLTVLDQGRTFVRRLSPSEIALGRIQYTRPTGEIRVSLLFEHEGAAPLVLRAHYQGPPPQDATGQQN